MARDWLELGIIAFIMIGIAYVVWRNGQSNPVGTGTLQHSLKNARHEIGIMARDMKTLAAKMDGFEEDAISAETIESLRRDVHAERERTNKVFGHIELVQAELKELRIDQGAKGQVITALSKSVRTIADQLEQHRRDVNEKLDRLDAMSERIDGNRRAIDAISTQLPGIKDKQNAMAEQVASTATDVGAVKKQVDRIYDVLVTKGMG